MRGKKAQKRKPQLDAKYNSALIAKIINNVMKGGKKTVAENIVYKAIDLVGKRVKSDKKPNELFEEAFEKVKPKVEVRPRRVGGATYQVPTSVPEYRQQSLAIRWIIEGARQKRKNKQFYKTLADEVNDALKGTGYAVKKKEDAHKMAEANKAFAHFQW